MLIVLLLLLVAASGMASNGTRPLPRGPDDGILLENDLLGFRVWGPPSQPTITLGRSDVWDRRWFSDRQPLITLSRIRELAMSSRASEVPTSGHKDAIYDNYDFPCPKPGMQIILETPFATKAEVWGVTNNFERNKHGLSALTLTRYLLNSASEAARVLGRESQETKSWREMTKRLAPYPT